MGFFSDAFSSAKNVFVNDVYNPLAKTGLTVARESANEISTFLSSSARGITNAFVSNLIDRINPPDRPTPTQVTVVSPSATRQTSATSTESKNNTMTYALIGGIGIVLYLIIGRK